MSQIDYHTIPIPRHAMPCHTLTIRLSSVSLLVLLSITGGLLLFLDQSILIVVNYSSLLAIHHHQQHPILPTEIVTNTTIVTAVVAAAAAVATPITITNSATIAATSSSSTSLSSSKSSSSSSSSTEGSDKECYMTLDRSRKAIRYDPEQNAIPTLTFLNDDNSNNNNDSSSNSNNNNTMTMMTMEGLSNDYLRNIIRGRKVAIIGDSTLRNLVRWLVRLYDEQAKDLFWMNNNNNNNKMKKKNRSIIDSITGLGGLDDGNNNTNGASSLYRANKDILRIGFQPPCPMCDKDENGQKICACDPMKLENGFLHYYEEEEEDYLDDDNESTIETDIRYFDVRKSKVKTFINFQPNIVVFNSGLWLLHLYDIRKLGGTKNEEIDAILNWIQYEDIVLRPVIENAIQSKSIKVLLFKTTNHVCDDKYYGQYKDHIDLYNNNIININNNNSSNSNSNNNNNNNNSESTNLLMECKNYFLKLLLHKQQTNKNLPESWSQPRDDGSSLLEDYVDNYCMNGTLSDHGSNYLNNRLVKFVNDFNANNTNNNNSMVVQIFNDHDMQDCSYTTVGDGRHFQGMNLLRIRLLLNQLDCILS